MIPCITKRVSTQSWNPIERGQSMAIKIGGIVRNYRVELSNKEVTIVSNDTGVVYIPRRSTEDDYIYNDTGKVRIHIEAIHAYTPAKLLEIRINEQTRMLEYAKEEFDYVKHPIEVGDKLKYIHEGKDYKVLYVSPAGTVIVSNETTERTIGHKDVKLQNAFGFVF